MYLTRIMTLEFRLMKGDFTPFSQILSGFCFNIGHFEAFKTGMTCVISNSNHQLMTLDSDSLFKNLHNEFLTYAFPTF